MAKGRPVGSRNLRTQEVWDKLKDSTDPAMYLASIVDNENADAGLRVTAANYLMPYKYSKRGLTPEPAPLVYIADPVTLAHPHATCIADTIVNVEHVSELRRSGRLDQDTADRLVVEQRIIRDGLIEAAATRDVGFPHGCIFPSTGPSPGRHIVSPIDFVAEKRVRME